MSDFTALSSLFLFLSVIVAVPLMFVLRVLYTYFIASFQKKKKLQQAKDAGHVVEAWCVKRKDPRGTPEPTDRYFATYSFEYKGKEYKRHFKFLNAPPMQLTMYFVKKPSKAEPESSFIGMEAGLLPFYLCGVIVSFILMVVFFKGRLF